MFLYFVKKAANSSKTTPIAQLITPKLFTWTEIKQFKENRSKKMFDIIAFKRMAPLVFFFSVAIATKNAPKAKAIIIITNSFN